MISVLKNIFKKEQLSHDIINESAETVFIDLNGKIKSRREIGYEVLRQELPGGECLDMVYVPSGSFSMGSIHSKGYKDEEPQHYVHINKFLVSQTTVTQRQWKAVMGKLPPCRSRGEDFPVDRVSWHDALRFITRLIRLTGKLYRLPTESEWEYACRAGSSGHFCYGNMITTDYSNYVGEHVFADGPKGVYRHGPVEPKMFPPNAFGIYDMHGNMWEWCEDTWHENYSGAPVDGEAWLLHGTEERVLRGGSWHDPPDLCRSACRLKLMPAEGEDYTGIRLALSE